MYRAFSFEAGKATAALRMTEREEQSASTVTHTIYTLLSSVLKDEICAGKQVAPMLPGENS